MGDRGQELHDQGHARVGRRIDDILSVRPAIAWASSL
jgi:hypothetical protein